jgi:uncharacterized protein
LPRSETTGSGHDMHFVGSVLGRWRGATSHRDPTGEHMSPERLVTRTLDAPMLQPSLGFDHVRFSLLKKPLR